MPSRHAHPHAQPPQPPPPPTPPPQSLKDFLLQNEENKAIREAEKQKRWAEDAEYQQKWQEQLDRQERERLARCGGVGVRVGLGAGRSVLHFCVHDWVFWSERGYGHWERLVGQVRCT